MGNRDTKLPVPKSELYYCDKKEGVFKTLVDDNGQISVKLGGIDGSTGQLPVSLKDSIILQISLQDSGILLGTDVQAVYTQASSFLTAKSVGAGLWDVTSAYTYVGDASKFVTKVKLGSSKKISVDLYWSDDQTNIDLVENIVVDKTTQWESIISEVKGAYVKVAVKNGDVASLIFDVKGFKRSL